MLVKIELKREHMQKTKLPGINSVFYCSESVRGKFFKD